MLAHLLFCTLAHGLPFMQQMRGNVAGWSICYMAEDAGPEDCPQCHHSARIGLSFWWQPSDGICPCEGSSAAAGKLLSRSVVCTWCRACSHCDPRHQTWCCIERGFAQCCQSLAQVYLCIPLLVFPMFPLFNPLHTFCLFRQQHWAVDNPEICIQMAFGGTDQFNSLHRTVC